MNDRKRQIVNLVIKMTILIFLHFACNCVIAGWAICTEGHPITGVECMVQELLFMAVFQVFICINYRVKKLTIIKYKIIYITTDLLFLLLTFLFWCVIVVGPLWLHDP